MKSSFVKIIGGTTLAVFMVLIYTAAVTQPTGSNHYSKDSIPITDEDDTINIGSPIDDNPWKELDKLVKTYYIKSGVFYQGEMKLFDGNSDKDKLMEEKKFEYTYFNNGYTYNLSPLEVIDKPNYTVIVNHDDKLIAVAPKVGGRKSNTQLFNLSNFKKLIEQQNAQVKLTQHGDERVLTVDSLQDATIQGYRIYYSPITYRINKILVGMIRPFSLEELDEVDKKEEGEKEEKSNKLPDDDISAWVYYLEIDYSIVKPLLLQGEFNPENKFVKMEGNKIELTPEYKDYELYNSDQP